ncbi:MAG TPA: ribosome biogenesis GTP-binding protein YihA/YsxC [Polyangiaceae bacterium]|nr:ribosome biogenesis GTP-binding protein YihA/YsxC [Polyangiaceae bacterium]
MAQARKPAPPDALRDTRRGASAAAKAPRIVSAEFSAAAKAQAELPAPLQVEIAFAGRSNVGKSSLLNKLMNRKNLARTSSTPGCTRQINFFSVRTAQGLNLNLVDLPGYGYAQRSKEERKLWAELIDSYLLERPTLRAVAVLVDVRRGLEADDLGLLEMLASGSKLAGRAHFKTLIVATKLDKLRPGERAGALAQIKAPGSAVFGVSTELPETTAALWASLERQLGLTASANAADEGERD